MKRKKVTKNSGKKYTFVLKNVNTAKVNQRFGISIVSNLNVTNKQPVNTTQISELSYNKNTPEIISFLDDSKKNHKCTVSMIDFESRKKLDQTCVYQCFWCRILIPSNILAIGCPIRYIPSQLVKNYYSEISKDRYVIKEYITPIRKKNNFDSKRFSIIENDYYITDGIFCSFNCGMAFILDNSDDPMYDLSEMLLLKIYNMIYPNNVPSIDPAPHWKKLRKHGGDKSDDEFRGSFNKVEYVNHGFTSGTLKFQSIGVLFEEKLKF